MQGRIGVEAGRAAEGYLFLLKYELHLPQTKSKSFIRLLNASLELAYDVASAATLFIPVVNCI